MNYSLQIKNGARWQFVIAADTVAALKAHATNIAADYRVVDNTTGLVRTLNVTPSRVLLDDAGWLAL